jgi:hypothetical protein
MATILSSFAETRNVLIDRGIELSESAIRDIAVRYARRAEACRQLHGGAIPDCVSGRRVVISTDGGRIRIRKNKRGPKTEKGRNRYHTEWKEPKLLIIYTVNEDGSIDKSFCPFINGTMKGPDAVFGLITYYLEQLDICKADKILFVADGARWIWNRVSEMMLALGVAPGRFYELVDFYHAVEHLGKIAELRKKWNKSEKKRWLTKHRRLLLNGKVADVIDSIRILCRGRASAKLRRERNYFFINQHRMNYSSISEKGLPIGSGAMESAVRRVVNLRLKGASIYWLKETAEAMLLLRSYYKAGRWDMLRKLATYASF